MYPYTDFDHLEPSESVKETAALLHQYVCAQKNYVNILQQCFDNQADCENLIELIQDAVEAHNLKNSNIYELSLVLLKNKFKNDLNAAIAEQRKEIEGFLEQDALKFFKEMITKDNLNSITSTIQNQVIELLATQSKNYTHEASLGKNITFTKKEFKNIISKSLPIALAELNLEQEYNHYLFTKRVEKVFTETSWLLSVV